MECEKTPMLDAFIQTMTTIPEVLLISEYCASSTEKYIYQRNMYLIHHLIQYVQT